MRKISLRGKLAYLSHLQMCIRDSGWGAKPESFEMAREALETWFAHLSRPSAATVASYSAILSTYMKAVGYPIDVAAVVGDIGDKEHSRKIVALSNLEVRRLRLALSLSLIHI